MGLVVRRWRQCSAGVVVELCGRKCHRALDRQCCTSIRPNHSGALTISPWQVSTSINSSTPPMALTLARCSPGGWVRSRLVRIRCAAHRRASRRPGTSARAKGVPHRGGRLGAGDVGSRRPSLADRLPVAARHCGSRRGDARRDCHGRPGHLDGCRPVTNVTVNHDAVGSNLHPQQSVVVPSVMRLRSVRGSPPQPVRIPAIAPPQPI